LVETDEDVGEYSTLSHCWGFFHLLKTTTTILADMKLSIPWDLLSKTFKDAIIITHELGLRYIWIDSLCIIQDDVVDWETESRNMGNIYKNSTVTIAALKSKNGTGGCFVDEDQAIIFTNPHGDSSIHASVAMRQCHEHDGWGYQNYNYDGTRPLFGRAWTMQEELLSPRVLYYGSREIAFQCREMMDCQCGRIAKDYNTSKRLYEMAKGKWSSPREIMKSWASTIEQYSFRQLTFETDRFPALSGLTDVFGSQLGQSIFGLWTLNLPLWMLWSTSGGKRTKEYVAPSWSWASLRGGIWVRFVLINDASFNTLHTIHLTIDDVGYGSPGINPAGTTRRGRLHVRGRTVSAQLLRGRQPQVVHSSTAIKVKLDVKTSPEELDSTPVPEAVECLLVCTQTITAWFLILSAVNEEGQYERCGIGFAGSPGLTTRNRKYSAQYDRVMKEWFNNAAEKSIVIV
jgi:hypothetical protein